MHPSLLAIIVTGMLGCGGADPFTDAGSGDDAPDAAGDDLDGSDGPTGPVAVQVLGGYGVPRPDRPVLFHDAGGALVARTITDADGRASAEVAAGSSVTVIDDQRLTTVLAVVPGDQLVVGWPRDGGVPIGTATVHLPAGGATYGVSGPCMNGSGASTAVSVWLGDACAATRPLLAVRNPGYGADGYIYVAAQALAVDATVTLAGPWQTPGAFPVSLTGLTGVDYALLRTWVVTGGQRMLAASAAEPAADGDSISTTMPYPTGAGDATMVSVTIGDSAGTRRQSEVSYDGEIRDGLTLDAAVLLPVPTLTAPTLGGALAWQAGDGHDGIEITLQGVGDKGEDRGRWDVVAPPATRSLALPELPDDLAEAWQPVFTTPSVSVIDSSAIDGYDSFRAAVALSGHVPYLLDGPLRVRTATATASTTAGR